MIGLSHRRQSGGKLSAGITVLAAAVFIVLTLPAKAQTQQADAVNGITFAAPPRTIADITAILDQEKPDPALVATNKAKADAQPPAGVEDIELARFYSDRGTAAGDLGRETQRLADYSKAHDILAANKDKYLGFYALMVNQLAVAEMRAGKRRDSLNLRLDIVNYLESLSRDQTSGGGKKVPRGNLFTQYYGLVSIYVGIGQFDQAEATIAKLDALREQMAHWRNSPPGFPEQWSSLVDWAHGIYLNATGKQGQSEEYLRKAAAENQQAVAIMLAQPPGQIAVAPKA